MGQQRVARGHQLRPRPTTPLLLADTIYDPFISQEVADARGDQNGVDLGPFYITELDASLNMVWKFQSTNTRSCVRQPDGSMSCTDDHPHGFEWCINAAAVDRDGTVYANSEDGNAYAITADGKLRDSFFLQQSLGAAYTPIALDHTGRVFALNNGHLTILGGK